MIGGFILLDEQEFEIWCDHNNISVEARKLIAGIRRNPPVRNVGGGAINVCGRFPSKKMGFTIQFESHRVELPAIYQMEYVEEDVLEYYDQPSRIKLVYIANTGKNTGLYHIPDFLVLREDSAGWEEWKEETKLRELSEKMPNRYVKDENGLWRCPPGEEYAKKFGLYYRLRSSAEINLVRYRNLVFLDDFLRSDKNIVSTENTEKIVSIVKLNPGISLKNLIDHEGLRAVDVYVLLINGKIYVDLDCLPLAEPDRVHVFIDEVTEKGYKILTSEKAPINALNYIDIKSGTNILWNNTPWEIINVGSSVISMINNDKNIVELPSETFDQLLNNNSIVGINQIVPVDTASSIKEILIKTHPNDLDIAYKRNEIVISHLQGHKILDIPYSTLATWRQKFQQAEVLYGKGLFGLIPKTRNKGNRNAKLDPEVIELMYKTIEEEYENSIQKSMIVVFGQLKLACKERGLIPPSYKTLTLAIKNRPLYEKVLKRQGKRAAYEHESFFWYININTPRHGDRPFEIGHIDHTQLDMELKSLRNWEILGRPWLSILLDAYARRILAFYLTFDEPSYRSCMMVIRECVKRHQRIPQNIVVDGGREFRSIYFESLLASLECVKKTRPFTKARFGSVCERIFGTTQTQFIHNLIGNTQVTKNVRQMDKDHNPKKLATWDFRSLYYSLEEYLYEFYDTNIHSTLGQSPRDYFNAGLIYSADREGYKKIAYDENFLIQTLPSTKKGTAKVDSSRGVKICYLNYWSELFRKPSIAGTQIPVRYDPYDISKAYAYVGNQWVICREGYHNIFVGRSEKEVKFAIEELRKEKQNSNKNYINITAKEIAEMLQRANMIQKIHSQRIKDEEATGSLRVIEGGKNDKKQFVDFSKIKLTPTEIYEKY